MLGAEYMRMMLEDLPMSLCQLYSIYRRQIGLSIFGYLGFISSIFGIYNTLLDIMVQVENQVDFDDVRGDFRKYFSRITRSRVKSY